MSEQILCDSIENITENHDIYRSFLEVCQIVEKISKNIKKIY